MAISLKTRKMLWGRAANRCAFPDCPLELVIDATETDDESLIGEECHIVAKSPEGPRGNSPLTSQQRDRYENLVLLCAVHHKLVDDQDGTYTIDHLHQMKQSHEAFVRESLSGFDPVRQRDEEQYAGLVQEFCDMVDINNWESWSSWVLGGGGYPRISIEIHTKLNGMRNWLLSRVWPTRYPEIESSFQNFRLVLNDFLNVFAEHSEPYGDEMLATKKFYRISEWDPEKYNYLAKQHDFHVRLVQDLMLELTRAANYVCDRVRERFFPTFRLGEGVLLVTDGPYVDMSYRTRRCEYREPERTDRPYPGLAAFKSVRESRDHSFGCGPLTEAAGEDKE